MVTVSGSLDTNVLLRLLLNDVADQHHAVVKLFQNSRGKFEVADTAIIEVVFGLERHYGFTRTEISQAIEGLMSLPEISCHQELFQKALPFFVKNPKLSFEDCCLAVYAELNNALPLWTFDQKLAGQMASTKLIPLLRSQP